MTFEPIGPTAMRLTRAAPPSAPNAPDRPGDGRNPGRDGFAASLTSAPPLPLDGPPTNPDATAALAILSAPPLATAVTALLEWRIAHQIPARTALTLPAVLPALGRALAPMSLGEAREILRGVFSIFAPPEDELAAEIWLAFLARHPFWAARHAVQILAERDDLPTNRPRPGDLSGALGKVEPYWRLRRALTHARAMATRASDWKAYDAHDVPGVEAREETIAHLVDISQRVARGVRAELPALIGGGDA